MNVARPFECYFSSSTPKSIVKRGIKDQPLGTYYSTRVNCKMYLRVETDYSKCFTLQGAKVIYMLYHATVVWKPEPSCQLKINK